MSGSASLLLVYEIPGGRPLTVARTVDQKLLLNVAQHVLEEAGERAKALADADEVLGAVEREEVRRLRRVLEILTPELKHASWIGAPVM
jgi:hypothetical protein